MWSGQLTDNLARATNVSPGGCYVETVGRADVGERVTIDMILSPLAPMRRRGEVVHCQWPLGLGLRFVDLIDGEWSPVLRLVGGRREEEHPRPGDP